MKKMEKKTEMALIPKKILAIFYPLILFLMPFTIHSTTDNSLILNQEISHQENALEKTAIEKKSFSLKSKSLTQESSHGIASLNLKEIFSAAPIIYTILLLLSIISFTLWIYAWLTFRTKDTLIGRQGEELKRLLFEKKYETALAFCRGQKKSLIAKLLCTAISSRHHGAQYVVEAMKAEGKRATSATWQKISLLNDIVIVSPMLGLLGTVLGMFYAFYDLNRSAETLSSLFDGLGIAVGSTVTGLIVAILSMVFASSLKYRTMKALSRIENEAIVLSHTLLSKDN